MSSVYSFIRLCRHFLEIPACSPLKLWASCRWLAFKFSPFFFARMCPEFFSQYLHCSWSFYTRQHLSSAAGPCVAAIGTTGLSHQPSPLLCMSPTPPPPYFPFPVFCISSSTLRVSCQLCLAMVSLLGSPYHTSPMSCLSAPSLFPAILILSFNPPACD